MENIDVFFMGKFPLEKTALYKEMKTGANISPLFSR
jgi:hypothetical protein